MPLFINIFRYIYLYLDMLICVRVPLLAPITLGRLNKEPVSHQLLDVAAFALSFTAIFGAK